MEMSLENSLYSYLKQTKISFFFFYKIREQKGRTGLVWGLIPVGREKIGHVFSYMRNLGFKKPMKIEEGLLGESSRRKTGNKRV
jgi:hypothetical protein